MARKKMQGVREEIEVPEGIQVNLDGIMLSMKKEDKELKRNMGHELKVEVVGNKIILSSHRARRMERSLIGTFRGHVNNMIKGLEEEFAYELEIANVHFPMTVEYDAGKKQFTIKNMLGEKYPRILTIKENVDVELKAPKIHIKSHNIEAAGAVASKLEFISKVRNRDRNKFQDGIFITKKPGKIYLA
jgi:large subunit ribosomal protein L6